MSPQSLAGKWPSSMRGSRQLGLAPGLHRIRRPFPTQNKSFSTILLRRAFTIMWRKPTNRPSVDEDTGIQFGPEPARSSCPTSWTDVCRSFENPTGVAWVYNVRPGWKGTAT